MDGTETLDAPSGRRVPGAGALAWWRALPARERRLVGFAATALVLALVWLFALAPALRTIARVPAQIEAAEAQLQSMQRLADQMQDLRGVAPVGAEQARVALEAATKRLGDAGRLTLRGDRAVLTLNGVGTTALRDWLAEARAGARARPVEASLTRAPNGLSGTIVLTFGAAS